MTTLDHPSTRAAGTTSFGPFRFDAERGRLTRGEILVPLGSRAEEILRVLVEQAPQIVSKSMLMDRVWPGMVVEEGALRFHVSALRRALGRDTTGQSYISTASGRGYRLLTYPDAGQEPGARPLRDGASRRGRITNLPPALSNIIGRTQDLQDLGACIEHRRMVTIAGPGGVGKTRLAMEFGRQQVEAFLGGVWLVDLAPVTEPSAVTVAVATALSLAVQDVNKVEDLVVAAISRDRTLLIFDNCEHIVVAVGELIQRLLERAPSASILATSQKPLELAAEQIFSLDPLETPAEGVLDVSGYAAVQLFVERVQAADRHFSLDLTNSTAVAEICRRLDGVPLSLELAAWRARLLGVEELRQRLAERLQVLSGLQGQARHASLMDLLEWSYSLLPAFEQRVLRALAVFPASFTLEAAVAVASHDEAERWIVVDALSTLINQSLLTLTQREPTRFRLLESQRLYIAKKLHEAGEIDDVALRHARHYTQVFSGAELALEDTSTPQWIAIYKPDLYNLRTALDWTLGQPEREDDALALAACGFHLLRFLNLFSEGQAYSERCVALLSAQTAPEVSARALNHSAHFLLIRGDPRGLELAKQAEQLCRQIGDGDGLATALLTISRYALNSDDCDLAAEKLSETKNHLKATTSKHIILRYAHGYANYLMQTGDFASALTLHHENLKTCFNNQAFTPVGTLANIGLCYFMLNKMADAISFTEEALTLSSRDFGGISEALLLTNLGAYHLKAGSLTKSRAWLRQALDKVAEEVSPSVERCLRIWAALFAEEGCLIDAAQLAGFCDVDRERFGRSVDIFGLPVYNRLNLLLDAGVEVAELLRLKAIGAAWRHADAVAFVRAR